MSQLKNFLIKRSAFLNFKVGDDPLYVDNWGDEGGALFRTAMRSIVDPVDQEFPLERIPGFALRHSAKLGVPALMCAKIFTKIIK
jgi:hypothetical protein